MPETQAYDVKAWLEHNSRRMWRIFFIMQSDDDDDVCGMEKMSILHFPRVSFACIQKQMKTFELKSSSLRFSCWTNLLFLKAKYEQPLILIVHIPAPNGFCWLALTHFSYFENVARGYFNLFPFRKILPCHSVKMVVLFAKRERGKLNVVN